MHSAIEVIVTGHEMKGFGTNADKVSLRSDCVSFLTDMWLHRPHMSKGTISCVSLHISEYM